MMYDNMASIYDTLMDDVPYYKWIQFTEEIVKEHSDQPLTQLLDLGCGTGTLTLSLASLFDQVVGIDQSQAMIDIAKVKTQRSSHNVTFVQEDARELHLNQSFDMIVSYCDVVNYLTDWSSLEQMIDTAYHHLNSNGFLIFDSHSPSYVQYLIEAEMFTDIRDDLSVIWLCEAGDQSNEVVHDLTFFVEESEGLYRRFDETHTQRVFPVNQMKQMLESKGFSLKAITGDWGRTNDLEDADRVFYVCQKNLD